MMNTPLVLWDAGVKDCHLVDLFKLSWYYDSS